VTDGGIKYQYLDQQLKSAYFFHYSARQNLIDISTWERTSHAL